MSISDRAVSRCIQQAANYIAAVTETNTRGGEFVGTPPIAEAALEFATALHAQIEIALDDDDLRAAADYKPWNDAMPEEYLRRIANLIGFTLNNATGIGHHDGDFSFVCSALRSANFAHVNTWDRA